MSAQVGIAGTTKVGSNCFIAGQVGIADHVTVGNAVKIGSKSGIDKNVADGEIRFGYPALPGVQYHRSFAVFRQLPDMAYTLRKLEKSVAALEAADKE
jgi:UDP-3-O-[3-hydroxymyristoyl] glucosamine N-acyltransferase